MTTNRSDRGQSTLELALILPLVAVLSLALVHLGLAVSLQLQLEAAAREAARAAAIEPARARTQAESTASRILDGRRVDVATNVGSEWVVVELRARTVIVPFVGAIGARTLSADASMRREDLLRD